MNSSPKIIRSKRKTIALVVQPDGELLVRAPQRATQKQIKAMLTKYADWVIKKQAEVKARDVVQPSRRFVSGEKFFFLGEQYLLEFVGAKKPTLRLNTNFQLAGTAQENAKNLFENWYKQEARHVFNERVEHYAKKHAFTVKQVKLSSAQTRWGSCSSKGYINLTWRLVMAPIEIVDYVVVHELCHLREPNHSPAFWAQVATIIPDYKERRRWLKDNGNQFYWQ